MVKKIFGCVTLPLLLLLSSNSSQAAPPADDSRLANLSTRAFVSTNDDVVIAGFLLSGSRSDNRMVVRGIGPSLAAAGLTDVLADPILELRDTNGALILSNNDWQDNPDQAAEVSAAGLAPTNGFESAMVGRCRRAFTLPCSRG